LAGAHRLNAGKTAGIELRASLPQTREDSMSPGSVTSDVVRDLLYAWRSLRRSPGFTFTAIFCLALGLGLATVTTSLVNAYLIRSLPFPSSERLYHVSYAAPGQPEPRGLAQLDWRSLRDVAELVDSSSGARFYLTNNIYTDEANGMLAAEGTLEAFGLRPVIGQPFRPEDFRPGAERVALIGQGMWQSRFGGDPAIVGQQFFATVGNQATAPAAFRIVGVLPPDFRDPRGLGRGLVEVVAPLSTPARAYMIRLAPGVQPQHATIRLNEEARRVVQAPPADWPGVRIESVHGRYVANMKPMLTAVSIAVAMVLVLACANAGILILLRALKRRSEVAVRVALGADRRHVLRLLTLEALIICGIALVAGLVISGVTWTTLSPVLAERLGQPVPLHPTAAGVDLTVVGIVGSAALLAALALALLPTMTFSPTSVGTFLRSAGRSGMDSRGLRRLQASLVTFEVAVSLGLAVGCGLMIRSVAKLTETDFGFQTQGILRARIALPARTYGDSNAIVALYNQLEPALAALSSGSAALSGNPPFFEPPRLTLEVDGSDRPAIPVPVATVSGSYFSTLVIPLRAGRGITTSDRLGTEPVAVVSEALARTSWPNASPIGARIRMVDPRAAASRNPPPTPPWRTVVGVVGNIKQSTTDQDLNDAYIPLAQAPSRFTPIYARTQLNDAAWIERLRATVGGIDPTILVAASPSLEGEVERRFAGPRFLAALLSAFTMIALVMAMVAIYAVVAYSAKQREREVAIRVALGASPGAVTGLFFRGGAVVVGSGVLLGSIFALVIARVLRSQLFGIDPFDLLSLTGAVALTILAGMIAVWWPARRAASTSPMIALKDG
jgi:putative ABC transport system permease protein